MKKLIAVGLLGLMGVMMMAATCSVVNTRLTTINGKKVFAGELKNDSGVDILNHKFRVSFIDSGNNLLETKTVDGCLRSVQTGTSDYFSVKASSDSASSALARLANYAEDTTFKVGKTHDSDLAITVLNIRRDADNIRVTGTIKNQDSSKLYSPHVCVVVWDDSGHVTITGSDLTNIDLADGATTDFDVSIDLTDISDIGAAIKTVDVGVDGLNGSSDGTPVTPFWDRDNTVKVCGTPTNTPTHTNTPAGTSTPTATATNTVAPTNTPGAGTPTVTNTATTVPNTATSTPCAS